MYHMRLNTAVSVLILRIVLGVTFLVHGIMKFTMGLDAVAGMFAGMGLPGFLGYAVSVVELVGGAAMILGLGTRVVAFLFACVMVGAIVTVKWSVGFVGNEEVAGYEFDLALLAISVSLLLTGGGRWALDRFFDKEEHFS
jgi:putative oxidoreductase